MKKILNICFAVFFIVCSISVQVFAVGDGNVDGGGGGMESGTSNNIWSVSNEGVRVTVIDAETREVVTAPIDLTNKKPSSNIFHFGKISKIEYTNGNKLLPQQGGYSFKNPSQPLPKIVSTGGKNNIEAIKSYFTDEQVIRAIAETTGVDYEILISGKYRLLLEPFAFYTFEGSMILTTATEAALYDQQLSGRLRSRMVSLSHQNLPLSMFLEVPDLGYSVWTGSKVGVATNEDIKTYLGIGIVRFTELPEIPVISGYDYEYRVDTQVVTSVWVSGGQSDPDNDTTVTFDIDGIIYTVKNIYYPEGDSQLAWVKWTTPPTEQDMIIYVYVNGSGGASKAVINCKIVDMDKNPPPNPVADDRNDEFIQEAVPQRDEKQKLEWNIWRPWWKEYWVDRGYWSRTSWTDSDGNSHSTSRWVARWVDEGWWCFELDKYYATLTANIHIIADENNPTASETIMKSGYGINQLVATTVDTNQKTAVTFSQNAVSYFPEFGYETYWRLLDRVGNGVFTFKENSYSTYKNRTHFTPVWFPDGKYEVNTWVIDSWSPAGMLSLNLTDKLNISGSLWEDWHIGPLKP
ncbi:MAG: hypothetical protein ACRCW1_04360 [Anaerotignaceae bacterium]